MVRQPSICLARILTIVNPISTRKGQIMPTQWLCLANIISWLRLWRIYWEIQIHSYTSTFALELLCIIAGIFESFQIQIWCLKNDNFVGFTTMLWNQFVGFKLTTKVSAGFWSKWIANHCQTASNQKNIPSLTYMQARRNSLEICWVKRIEFPHKMYVKKLDF